MIRRFWCPRLNAEVELTAERARHIEQKHADLWREHRDKIAEVLADPDVIRRGARAVSERRFSRWYTNLGRGRHVVVVVVSEERPVRHWVVTAHMARRVARGGIEWRRG